MIYGVCANEPADKTSAIRRLTPTNGVRALTTANAGKPSSWRDGAGTGATNGGAGLAAPTAVAMRGKDPASAAGPRDGTRPGNVSAIPNGVSPIPAARCNGLSVRAENVLKVLAAELMGEKPPRGRWTPSGQLLRKLDFGILAATPNCGPQTTDEIIRWAGSHGVVIERPFHAGKSLSTMWRDIIAKSSAEEFASAEIAEALERSLRRKNTRIPVAFQNLLVKVLNATGK
jgi:hypothetical protein